MQKPTRNEVIQLAITTADRYIKRKWRSLPAEQADEAKQNAAIRAHLRYDDLDFEDNWQALVRRNAKGAVLDYVRDGDGFEESVLKKPSEVHKTSDQDSKDLEAEQDKATVSTAGVRLSSRVDMVLDEDGTVADVEQILGLYGVFSEIETSDRKINWPLVARLSSEHFDVLVIALLILGFYPQEVAEQMDISRERILQVAGGFISSLDTPENIGRKSTEQIIYALGLSEYFHQRSIDNGYGWDFKVVDLFDPQCVRETQFHRATLPGYEEKRGDCHKKQFKPASPKKEKVLDDGLTEEDRKNQLKFEFEV